MLPRTPASDHNQALYPLIIVISMWFESPNDDTEESAAVVQGVSIHSVEQGVKGTGSSCRRCS